MDERGPHRAGGDDYIVAVVLTILGAWALRWVGVFPWWLAVLVTVGGILFVTGELRGEYDR